MVVMSSAMTDLPIALLKGWLHCRRSEVKLLACVQKLTGRLMLGESYLLPVSISVTYH